MPSIPKKGVKNGTMDISFKPCYKWNAFNTSTLKKASSFNSEVLNLVISGMPSIQER